MLAYVGLVWQGWKAVKISSHFVASKIAGVSDLESEGRGGIWGGRGWRRAIFSISAE